MRKQPSELGKLVLNPELIDFELALLVLLHVLQVLPQGTVRPVHFALCGTHSLPLLLFPFLARHAERGADRFYLPTDRTLEVGCTVRL